MSSDCAYTIPLAVMKKNEKQTSTKIWVLINLGCGSNNLFQQLLTNLISGLKP